MNNRVCAVVVTYNPSEEVEGLIRALTSQCDQIVVVDNASKQEGRRRIEDACESHGAALIALEDNTGIAHAQNVGIEYARECGCGLVLLSDDDSLPPPDMVSGLVDALRRAQCEGRVAAVGPLVGELKPGGDQLVYVARRWGPRRAAPHELERPHLPVAFLIASGCLIDLAAIDDIGMMNDALFIDHVDLEWGLRARTLGWSLICATGVHMGHSLGDETVRIPGRKQPVHLHGPVRNYYLSRNTLLLMRSGLLGVPWTFGYGIWLMKYCTFNALFAPPRRERITMIARGILDACRGRTGPLGVPPVGRSQ